MLAGTLEIQMRADVARITADIAKVKGVVTNGMKGIESAVSTAKVALAGLGIGLGIAAMTSFITESARLRSALDDLSDTTGDNVKALDGLRRQAVVSGVAFDSVGGALTKLAKNMNNASEEGQAAAQGLKAIGLNVDNLRAMKPAEAMLEIAKALDGFQDGAGKVAVAMALMGKEGAKMLPYLKDLVTDGDAVGRITAEQAAQAEKAEKEWRRLGLAFKDGKEWIATAIIPALGDLAEQMRKGIEITGSFGSALFLLGTINPFRSMSSSIANIRDELEKAEKAQRAYLARGDVGLARGLTGRIDDLRKQGDFQKFMQQQNALKLTGPQYMDARDLRAAQKPLLDPGKLGGLAGEKKGAEEAESAYKRLMKTLQEKLLLDHERTEVAALLASLDVMSAKERAKLTEKEIDALKVAAAQVDVLKLRNAQIENNAKNEEALQKIRQEGAEMEAEADKLRLTAYDANQKTIEQIQFETSMIGKSNEVREQAIALRAMEASGIKQSDEAYASEAARLRDAIALKQSAQAVEDLAKKSKDEFNSMWSSVESTGKNVWQIMTAGGEGMAKSVGKAIKAGIIDLLYQMTVKKWLINIGTSLTGGMASGAAGAAGMVGNGLSLASGANSLSSLFSGGGALGAAGAGYSAVAGTVAAEGAMYAAAATVAEGVGAGLMAGLSAMGPLGWAAMGVGALFGLDALFGEGGGPKPSQLGIQRQPTGEFYVSQNDVPGGAGNMPLYNQLNAILNDPTKYDPAKLAGLTGYIQGGPEESADSMFRKLVESLAPAAESAKALATATKLVEEADRAAAEAAIVLAGARRDLEIRLMEAQGDVIGALAAKRELETAAADESLRSLLAQIYAQEDANKATQEAAQAQEQAAALASQRRGLDIALLDAQGNAEAALAAQRADALAALDASLRPLQAQIYAAQDAAKAQQALAVAQADSARKAQDLANAQRSVLSSQSALGNMVADLPGRLGITALTAANDSLAVSAFRSPQDQLAAAQRLVQESYARASGGDLGAVQGFGGVLQQALTIGRDVNASGPEFQRMFLDGNRMLQELLSKQQGIQADIIRDVPLSIQQASIDQIGALRKGFGEMVTELQALRSDVRRFEVAA